MIAKFNVFKASGFEWKGTAYQELTLLDASAQPIEQLCKLSMPVDKAPYKNEELQGKKISVNIEKIDVRNGMPSFRGAYEIIK
jgi:hypothetical protein